MGIQSSDRAGSDAFTATEALFDHMKRFVIPDADGACGADFDTLGTSGTERLVEADVEGSLLCRFQCLPPFQFKANVIRIWVP